MESFRIAQESVDERTQLIAVHGEMDRYQAPELEGMVDSAMSSGRRTVVVDICEATYMDSSAISRLIESSNRVRDGGGSFTLVCGRAPMRRSLEMKGLERVLDIVDTREEALDRAAQGGPGRD